MINFRSILGQSFKSVKLPPRAFFIIFSFSYLVQALGDHVGPACKNENCAKVTIRTFLLWTITVLSYIWESSIWIVSQ
jgi:hypothetical protein